VFANPIWVRLIVPSNLEEITVEAKLKEMNGNQVLNEVGITERYFTGFSCWVDIVNPDLTKDCDAEVQIRGSKKLIFLTFTHLKYIS